MRQGRTNLAGQAPIRISNFSTAGLDASAGISLMGVSDERVSIEREMLGAGFGGGSG